MKIRLSSAVVLASAICLGSIVAPSSVEAAGKAKSGGRAPAAAKKESKEPPILKGASITVLKLDRSNRTLLVQIDREPAVGPNIAKPEALIKAIGLDDEYDKKRYLDDPVRFVGSTYILQQDLELIPPPPEKPEKPEKPKKK